MKSRAINSDTEFEQVLSLITDARNRVYVKANAELVHLYFNVGKFVADRIEQGSWGDGTVNELATFIQSKMPNLSGFNRRGLYRMKQFYETYHSTSSVFLLWQSVNNPVVSPRATHLKNTVNEIVSALPSQLQGVENQHNRFVSAVLTQIVWMNHLQILSKTKQDEEKLFYLLTTINQKYSTRELERVIITATFERTMMSNKIVSTVGTQLPKDIFKDPYIFEFLNKDIEVVESAMARNTSPTIIAEYKTKLLDKKIRAQKLHQLTEILIKDH